MNHVRAIKIQFDSDFVGCQT